MMLLGFSFYGSGNIGDDLMLAGFLSEFPADAVQGFAMHVPSQQRRFPAVHWHDASAQNAATIETGVAAKARSWIGVGDTPFQTTSGTWFLDHLSAKLPAIRAQNKLPILMCGVGAEAEVLTERTKLRSILDCVDFIATRDEASTNILIEGGVVPSRIATGADLAHIALSRMQRPPQDGRPYALGINFFSEQAHGEDFTGLATYVAAHLAPGPVCFISNEFRHEFECRSYLIICAIIDQSNVGRRSWRRPWAPRPMRKSYNIGDTSPLFIPEYLAGSIESFVVPYSHCEVIMTSRYHGLLAAAWAGCKVGVLSGRSSKVDALANQLGIPRLPPPYAPERLRWLYESAVRVSTHSLELEAERAKFAVQSVAAMLR